MAKKDLQFRYAGSKAMARDTQYNGIQQNDIQNFKIYNAPLSIRIVANVGELHLSSLY
jgi:hypothetical protein